jgi:hypothetical protein
VEQLLPAEQSRSETHFLPQLVAFTSGQQQKLPQPMLQP